MASESCNDNRDPETGLIIPFDASIPLRNLINAAQIATCPEEGHICCNVKYAKKPPTLPKCTETDGYKYEISFHF